MDEHYKDQALVALYDTVNTSRDDFDFYRARLPNPPSRILDIGSGTGTFAVELAAAGYTVTGIDPAAAMIATARAKSGADKVDWLVGEISDLNHSAPFDAAVMTGHAFQCLLHDDQILDLFQSVAQRLTGRASFWFETRNPSATPWTRWTLDYAGPPIALADGVACRSRMMSRRLKVSTSPFQKHTRSMTAKRWDRRKAVSASSRSRRSRHSLNVQVCLFRRCMETGPERSLTKTAPKLSSNSKDRGHSRSAVQTCLPRRMDAACRRAAQTRPRSIR